jgi:hypothetical protein
MLGKQHRRRLPDNVRFLVPVQTAGAAVPAGQGTALVDAEDGIVGRIEDGGEEALPVRGVSCFRGVGVLGDRVSLRRNRVAWAAVVREDP